jgi:hypothetical protein
MARLDVCQSRCGIVCVVSCKIIQCKTEEEKSAVVYGEIVV